MGHVIKKMKREYEIISSLGSSRVHESGKGGWLQATNSRLVLELRGRAILAPPMFTTSNHENN